MKEVDLYYALSPQLKHVDNQFWNENNANDRPTSISLYQLTF